MDVWTMIEAELEAAPMLPTVAMGFAENIGDFMAKAEPGMHYIFGLDWGENPSGGPKGLRYTAILPIPVGTKSRKSPKAGIAWFFGMAHRGDGSTTFGNCLLVHEDSCRAGHGGRAWDCNCIAEIYIDEIPEHA